METPELMFDFTFFTLKYNAYIKELDGNSKIDV